MDAQPIILSVLLENVFLLNDKKNYIQTRLKKILYPDDKKNLNLNLKKFIFRRKNLYPDEREQH